MNLRVSRPGGVGLVVAVIVSAALFVYLMGQFGGPALRLSNQYRVSATFPDSKELAVRSDVSVRGVKVGQVERIVLHRTTADVTFSVQSRYAPIYRDATVRVGEKTLLGESYVDLDPGHRVLGPLTSGARLPARSTLPAAIEIDQALNALNPASRRHLKALLETSAVGAGAPGAPAQVGDTLTQLNAATVELRNLTDVLQGQAGDIASGVQAARVVVAQLGERQSAVRAIVSDARATLGAIAARDAALRAGITELPLLLSTAQVTLHHARPLLQDAKPLLADLRIAAPPLTSALRFLPPVTDATSSVIAGLSAFNHVALPVLALTRTVLSLANPVSLSIGPALRNLVTAVRYLGARRDSLAAWFSNTGDLGASRDAKGYFARFFLFMDPGTAFGFPGSFRNNAYTQPGDAGGNQAYSGYPRLLPYMPQPPSTRAP